MNTNGQTQKKPELIFFDYGGVLARKVDEVFTHHPSITKMRLERRAAYLASLHHVLHQEALLTGPAGTFHDLFAEEHHTIDVETLASAVGHAPAYSDGMGLVLEFRLEGVRTGLLSDQFAESADIVRELPFVQGYLDPIYFSSDLEMTKRDPDLFSRVAQEVDISPSRLLLIDDARENLDTAAEAGWQTCHYDPQHPERAVHFLYQTYGLLRAALPTYPLRPHRNGRRGGKRRILSAPGAMEY